MATAYPTSIDDNTTLGADMVNSGPAITDHTTQLDADLRVNNVKGALIALQNSVGATASASSGTVRYRIEGRMLSRYGDATDQWRFLTSTNMTSGNIAVFGHNCTSFPNSFTQVASIDYLGKVTATAYQGAEQTVTFSATPAFDATSAGETIRIVMTANITSWTLANGVTGKIVSIMFIQDGTGSRTLAGTPSNVKLAGGALTLTTTASKRDLITFRWDNTDSKWYEMARSLNL